MHAYNTTVYIITKKNRKFKKVSRSLIFKFICRLYICIYISLERETYIPSLVMCVIILDERKRRKLKKQQQQQQQKQRTFILLSSIFTYTYTNNFSCFKTNFRLDFLFSSTFSTFLRNLVVFSNPSSSHISQTRNVDNKRKLLFVCFIDLSLDL